MVISGKPTYPMLVFIGAVKEDYSGRIPSVAIVGSSELFTNGVVNNSIGVSMWCALDGLRHN